MFGLVIIIALIMQVRCQVYTLKAMSPPVKCVGGEACVYQPSVAVIDPQGQIALSYVGSACAQMQNSPTGFEPLYVGTCDYTSCGTKVVGVSGSGAVGCAPFVNGVAQFEVCILHTIENLHTFIISLYI